ncbi:MAG: magnesium and cobalt transport protein CorA [Actinobacteria bacterium]|uniref:Magnesium and cobalt transport protein CorA n=1 Tax=Candidatus Fonsibacter lacus TaxID=2576439 RepID=A0A965LL87_9PROT|nr:magnesium and cobalt transport protein CorA [Candidatus Fonsibacter lacus]
MIVDFAHYLHGVRTNDVKSIEELHDYVEQGEGFAWIGLAEPSVEELQNVLGGFELHQTAIEDAVAAQQRAKIEDFADITTFVIRTVFYDDSTSAISTGELICFIHRKFIIIVRHGSGVPLITVRHDLEMRPEFLALGPMAVLQAVLEKVITDYSKIAGELEQDVVHIESSVFSTKRNSLSREIYSLKREVIQRLTAEGRHEIPESLKPYFRDVMDQLIRACEHATGMDSLLTAALQADLAQVQLQQNTDVRMISAWVALAAAPTMIAGIYGMNFQYMPELHWKFSYPVVLISLITFSALLYRRFKKSGWL